MRALFALVTVYLSNSAGVAMEIAAGKMLGAGHDVRSFYLRQAGGSWQKTYTGPEFRPEEVDG